MDHSIQFLVKIQFLHLNYLVVEQLILNDHLSYNQRVLSFLPYPWKVILVFSHKVWVQP
jgi:hypothetical protein